MRFDPQKARRFVFEAYEFEAPDMVLKLCYRLDNHAFVESIAFSGGNLGGVNAAALDRVFHLLHLLAGISYYKAALPEEIVIETRLPSRGMAAFLERTYRHGLAEFAYTNGLDLNGKAVFPSADDGTADLRFPNNAPAVLNTGYVVPLGGGKDSLVSCDLLQQAHVPYRTIDVGGSPLIARVANVVGKNHITIGRRLDGHLLELNQRGAYNGHVPISAILAAVMGCGALLYGYDTVVMSNESSADVGNLELDDGSVVNHQYSKSLAFECEFAEIMEREVLPGFRYFSLLRGWSELAIARRFAELSGFHREFSSCNRNFQLNPSDAADRWCRDCPKCRFVFLALAPFMAVDSLATIFGRNLMNDASQIPGYRALLGIGATKPFECVGEVEESRAAMAALLDDPDWLGWPVVQHFKNRPELSGARLEPFLQVSLADRVPGAIRRSLDAA